MRRFDLSSDPTLEVARPAVGDQPLDVVRSIIAEVRASGDEALLKLTKRHDGADLRSIRATEVEIEEGYASSSSELIEAMEEAKHRIGEFAKNQLVTGWREEIGGAEVGEQVVALCRAGAYVPGGRATYPSSVLMTAVPARVAGVEQVAICVPPNADGSLPPSTLAAAKVAGVDEIYKVGGAQAIAALAYGTESIPRVDVVVGPGNMYVALAKQEVAGVVAIDSVAGPSEIAIVADGSADPRLIAWDLVAQAEHGPQGSFLVYTWDDGLAGSIDGHLRAVLEELGASRDLRAAIDEGAGIVKVASVDDAVIAVNAFAPEHLELVFQGAEEHASRFKTAGAIFVGAYSPVSLGDYLAGSNHVLPTGGAGRWASGLRASHFQKAIAVVKHTKESLRDASRGIDVFARTEGLPIHARAVRARFEED